MKKIIGMIMMVTVSLVGQSQAVKDKQFVDKLCGCFEVEFKYAETFSPDPKYKHHDRETISGGTELIFPVETTYKKIVMQHLLVITDSMIIKHWREDWTYENTELWKYKGDKTWTKEHLKPEQVKGKWTQSVWEVSDAPRYQGVSDWITTDNRTFWQNTTDAPLPRREYSVRDDYNVLRRTNRLTILDSGWVHEQDNQKLIRTAEGDKLLVEEKGINSYKRLPDGDCAAAKAYWDKNKEYWTRVRKTWENYIATHNSIQLKTMVNGKALHDHLFVLAKEYAAGKLKGTEADAKIVALIDDFIGGSNKTAALK